MLITWKRRSRFHFGFHQEMSIWYLRKKKKKKKKRTKNKFMRLNRRRGKRNVVSSSGPLLTHLKKPSPIFSTFFSNFCRLCYYKNAHIFLVTHGKFNSWKVFRLEDINENVSAYTVRCRQRQYTNLLRTSNGLTILTGILNLYHLSDDSPMETEN